MTVPRARDTTNARGCGCATVWLGLFSVACGLLIVLGSFDFRTTKTIQTGPSAWMGSANGFSGWPVWTLLLGAIALPPLVLAGFVALGGHRRLGAAFAFVAVPPFVASALVAGRARQPLLSAGDPTPGTTVDVAGGLAIVTLAGSVGALLAALLAIALLTLRR